MKKIIFLILSFITIYAQDAFISAHDLRNSFDNEKLVLIDVSDSYKISHIEGSISFDVNYLINKVKSYKALKSSKRLKEIFGDIGIENDSNVVIYARNSFNDFKKTTFLAFVLISIGFEKVSILDGAYMSWVFEFDTLITKDKRELESYELTNLKEQNFIVDAKYIQENINTINIIDARDANEYAQGHIENASSCSYRLKFKHDYTLMSVDDIKYSCLGYFKDLSKAVVYADDIFTSSLEWFIINRVMGFKSSKIYYNSFVEYKDLELDIIAHDL